MLFKIAGYLVAVPIGIPIAMLCAYVRARYRAALRRARYED